MTTPKCTPRINFNEEYDTASLKGKSAIVTGAGGGIGESIATELAKAGYKYRNGGFMTGLIEFEALMSPLPNGMKRTARLLPKDLRTRDISKLPIEL
jgi:NADP-dependent 3-hydroxy acid dehydrogenase YdfG